MSEEKKRGRPRKHKDGGGIIEGFIDMDRKNRMIPLYLLALIVICFAAYMINDIKKDSHISTIMHQTINTPGDPVFENDVQAYQEKTN